MSVREDEESRRGLMKMKKEGDEGRKLATRKKREVGGEKR